MTRIMNTGKEIWKEIKDFPMYEVSNMGRVKNQAGEIISQRPTKAGSNYVSISNGDGRSSVIVSGIVAAAFIPNYMGLSWVVNLDGDKGNNEVSNLLWMDRIDAINYISKTENKSKKKVSLRFKLSEKDMELVIRDFLSGKYSISQIAQRNILPKRRVVEIVSRYKFAQDKDKEVWRPIKEFPKYFVSNMGRVKSLARYKKGRILKSSKSKTGYLRFVLCKNGVVSYFSAHRLVAEAHVPNPQNKPQVNHIDGNKENNNSQNLEWVTQTENMRHAVDTGLKTGLIGDDHPTAKLSKKEVLEIRKKRNRFEVRLSTLSKEYGVSESQISLIARGKSWKHL